MGRAFQGVEIPPHWRILPPWVKPEVRSEIDGVPLIRINPGEGFGTGTHPTTQLCMQALGFLLRTKFSFQRMLDFGAGSGILAIGAARAGAHVEAVEIDDLALDNARENAELNGVSNLIDCRTHMSESPQAFDLIFANILNGVLLEFAEELCNRLSRQGRMVLSGLVSTDVPSVLSLYEKLLSPMRSQVYERGQWRAIMFTP